MSNTLQSYLVNATQKAADDLVAALMRLPEDKWAWSAMGDARTALDQIAECALLNGGTADMIKSRKWTMSDDFSEFINAKTKLAGDWNAAKALLEENTAKAIAAIGEVPDEDLGIEVTTPFGALTLSQIAAYPFWNMCYHEGQINYIASMLGCLK